MANFDRLRTLRRCVTLAYELFATSFSDQCSLSGHGQRVRSNPCLWIKSGVERDDFDKQRVRCFF